MSTSTLDQISAELTSEASAQAERRKQALREYFSAMADPASDKQTLRNLIFELGISPGDFAEHRQAFSELIAAAKAAPSAEQMTQLIAQRAEAERRVIEVQRENEQRLREAEARRVTARGAEGIATAAVTKLQEVTRRVESLFPETFQRAPKHPAPQFAQTGFPQLI